MTASLDLKVDWKDGPSRRKEPSSRVTAERKMR